MKSERLRCLSSLPAHEVSIAFRIPVRFFFLELPLAIFLAFSIPFVHARSAQAPEQKEAAPSPQELYKRLSPSVFVVESLDAAGSVVAKGSAVAVTPDEVVTNRHVIEDGASWRLKRGNHTWAATISHLDPDHDLCQLKAQGLAAPPVPVRFSATLAVGERVYAIGAPESLELTLSEGLISGLREFADGRVIQTSAAISPGSSGGGLFDSQGSLVGITTFYLKEGQNLNFALPGEWVAALAKREPPSRSTTESQSPAFRALIWFQLGNLAEEAGDHEKATRAYKEAIRLQSDAAAAWDNLGVAYGNMGRHDDAVKAHQEAIRLKRDDAQAWYNLGHTYLDIARYDDAIKALQEAIRLKPDYVYAWNMLGVAYLRLNVSVRSYQYDEAIKAFQEAIRLKSNDANAWYNLGSAYALQGNRAKVMQVYEALKQLDPERADKFFRNVVLP